LKAKHNFKVVINQNIASMPYSSRNNDNQINDNIDYEILILKHKNPNVLKAIFQVNPKDENLN